MTAAANHGAVNRMRRFFEPEYAASSTYFDPSLRRRRRRTRTPANPRCFAVRNSSTLDAIAVDLAACASA